MKKLIPLVVASFAILSAASAAADTRVVVVKPKPRAVVVHPAPVCVAPRAVTVVHPVSAAPVVKTRTVTGPLGVTRRRTVVVR